ncbi:hypothetical protein LUZ61_019302 [Rhynchospora tenuis]|uniref:DRBM domain-containing protein n=1 Tax=Rhynchospora tenuis TaxID=198213 RepID=A0AAD6EMQ7_9POAL|nr:hypothetical protein LUZ61_019302 [Rhynchospora tenuis]
MYKNQLQELAQRSCFNLPSYTSIREGPDHAPRFKAAVNFNGEVFESPGFCTTLRQAEHSAAEAALTALSQRGPSHSLAARILDETGVYKNLLQEVAQRVGAPLPSYTTIRSGLGHLPIFTCTVELAGITFTGDPAKNKKQAEKNAASAAWASLKQLAQQTANSSTEPENSDELEQIRIARALLNYRLKEKIAMAANNPTNPYASPFPKKFPMQPPTDSSRRPQSIHLQPAQANHSKILPLIRPKSNPRPRPESTTTDMLQATSPRPKFPAPGAPPYVPVRHYHIPCHAMAPPVTVRSAVPVFSAPPLPPPATAVGRNLPPIMGMPPTIRMASPVRIRPAVPVFSAPVQLHASNPVIPVHVKERSFRPSAQVEVTPAIKEVAEKEVSNFVSLEASTGLVGTAPAPSPPVQMEEDAPAVVSSPLVQMKVDTTSVVPSHPIQVKDVQGVAVVSEKSVEKRGEIMKDAALESMKQLEI